MDEREERRCDVPMALAELDETQLALLISALTANAQDAAESQLCKELSQQIEADEHRQLEELGRQAEEEEPLLVRPGPYLAETLWLDQAGGEVGRLAAMWPPFVELKEIWRLDHPGHRAGGDYVVRRIVDVPRQRALEPTLDQPLRTHVRIISRRTERERGPGTDE
jgi:hypothetical protein